MTKWTREEIESVYTLERLLTQYDLDKINETRDNFLHVSEALENWLMGREMRVIKCECGQYEEADTDTSRRKTQSFDLEEYIDQDNGGIYTCNECENHVKSVNVPYKFTLDDKYDSVIDTMVNSANIGIIND